MIPCRTGAIVIIFLSVIFFSGCAVHSPMSEMLMFQEKKAYNGETYRARYSHSLAGVTNNIYSESAVINYAKKEGMGGADTEYNHQSLPAITTNFIFMSDKIDRIAASIAVGSSLGADVTLRIYKHWYVSGVMTLPRFEAGQVILQKRIKKGPATGVSIGATYQREYQYLGIENVDCFCFPSDDFYTRSVGLRAVALVAPPSEYGESGVFVHFTGSLNYDITMETLFPKVGFSVGLY
ncbi:hypothetical protein [Fodinibius sp.]|uniref:hypothetical protein n=1 Tax=Fodinibius sp. TaxID=1872440 RepID=UPI002ACD9633|nr:hypothetical protein [Fodinibius sp.]MDZ7659042.1 hypothetical protein [Fodinibius sp.]